MYYVRVVVISSSRKRVHETNNIWMLFYMLVLAVMNVLLMHDKRCCKTLVTNRSMQFQEMSRLPKENENGKKARGHACKPTHSSFFYH